MNRLHLMLGLNSDASPSQIKMACVEQILILRHCMKGTEGGEEGVKTDIPAPLLQALEYLDGTTDIPAPDFLDLANPETLHAMSSLAPEHPSRWGQRLVELGLLDDAQLEIALYDHLTSGISVRQAILKRGWMEETLMDNIFRLPLSACA